MTHYYSKAVDVQPVIADITLYPDHAALVDAIFDEYCNRTNEPFEYAIRIDGLSRNADAYKQADVKHKLDVALTYCLSPQAMNLKEGYFDDDRKEDLR